MMLFLILRFLSEQQEFLIINSIEIAIQNYYFVFLFIQMFLTISLFSSITIIVDEIYYEFDFVSKVLAKNLSKTSNYFFSYILLQIFSINASQFIQISNRVKCYIVTQALNLTSRIKAQRKKSMHIQIQWKTLYFVFTNLACINKVFDTTILSIMFEIFDEDIKSHLQYICIIDTFYLRYFIFSASFNISI